MNRFTAQRFIDPAFESGVRACAVVRGSGCPVYAGNWFYGYAY